MSTIKQRNGGLGAAKSTSTLAGLIPIICMLFIGVSDAGIGGIGSSRGRISNFASIIVNDREHVIDDSFITIAGERITGAQHQFNLDNNGTPVLKIGQVVSVQGDFDVNADGLPVGTATDVVLTDNMEGTITSINEGEDILEVLGHSILTDANTIFILHSGSNSFEGLSLNIRVEVSGFPTDKGAVLASLIEQKDEVAGQPNEEITGTVSNLNGTLFSTFSAQDVDFSSAALTRFPYDRGIMDGDVVEAKGSFDAATDTFIAEEIVFQASIPMLEKEAGEFGGLITEFTSASEFSIADIQVVTEKTSNFIGGGPANLTSNTSVEVSGTFDKRGGGVELVADQIRIRGTRVRVEGPADYDSTYGLKVFGIPIEVNLNTTLEDDSSYSMDPPILYSGQWVEVRSVKDPLAGELVVAARVRITDPKSAVRLQGFLDEAGSNKIASDNNTYFKMHGVTINIDSNTTHFTDANDVAIEMKDFFDAVTPGTFVKVQGTDFTSTSITASSVELVLDD